MIRIDWSYFNKFDSITDKYLPSTGEGETRATQLVTAISKLVYKWYNDGDVYDNTHYLDGWCNDISSYANWIYKHYPSSNRFLNRISDVNEGGYELILKELADLLLQEPFLEEENNKPKTGSIYQCDGPFAFIEYDDEEEEW